MSKINVFGFLCYISVLIMLAISVNAINYRFLPYELSPSNNSVQTSSTVTFSFRTNQTSTSNCTLFTNASSSNDNYVQNKTFPSLSNNTKYSYVMRELFDSNATGYYWHINCSNTSNSSETNDTGNYYFEVDSVSPTVAFNSPSSTYTFDSDGNITINVTGWDTNPDNCQLYTNADTTTNQSNTTTNAVQNKSYTSGTSIRFDEPGYNRTLATGVYSFYVSCNDTAGHSTSTETRNVTVTRAFPSSVGCHYPLNNSMHTRLTTFNWSGISSVNLSYYNLTINKSGTPTSYIIYNNDTVSYQLTLDGDSVYSWSVIPYSKTGASNTSGNCTTANQYKVNTTSICSSFIAGWNACSWNTDTSENLSTIATQTGASVVATWNYTSNSFMSYVGNTTNAAVNVNRSLPTWLYFSSAVSSWEHTWSTNESEVNRTIFNASYVVDVPIGVTNQSGMTLKYINDKINSTCRHMTTVTLTNQTSGRHHTFFCGYNESNYTVAKFNNVIWLEWNSSYEGINYTG